MSQQLRSKGEAVGSVAYFHECNRKYGFEKWIPQSKPFAYAEGIQALGEKAEKTLSIMYDDCRKYAQYLRYFPEKDRDQTIAIAEGLVDLAALGGRRIWTASALISLLKLNASETRPFSSASVRDTRDAADDVVRGKYTSTSTQLDLLKKATERDMIEVRNQAEHEFLENICSGKHKDVLKDILMHAQYQREHDRMYGKCGYVICSERYLEWVEKEVFDASLKSRVGDKYNYRAYFSAQLLYLREEMTHDLEEGIRNNDYITDLYKDNLLLAAENLEKCGVTCYDLERKAKRLAWFVGGDPRKIKELQHKLNDLGLFQYLKEDGVYGKKTHEAVCEFHAKLESPNVPKLVKIGEVVDVAHNITDTVSDASENMAYFKVQNGYQSDQIALLLSPNGKDWLLHKNPTQSSIRFIEQFKGKASVWKTANKTLLVTGFALDALQVVSVSLDGTKDIEQKLVESSKTATKTALSTLMGHGVSQATKKVLPIVLRKLSGGALVGSAFGPVGTIAGAIIGDVFFALVGDVLIDSVVDGVFELIE